MYYNIAAYTTDGMVHRQQGADKNECVKRLEEMLTPIKNTTMTLEEQVCTLRQAWLLDKANIKESSLFYWNQFVYKEYGNIEDGEWRLMNLKLSDSWYPAYTTAELLKMNGQIITINELQLEKSAEAVADHYIFNLEHNH